MTDQVNQEAVKEIPSKNHVAETLFTLWAMRERNARDGKSTVDETRRQLQKEGYIVAPTELLPIFRSLQQAGAGTLKGNVFTWSRGVGLKELAKIAMERQDKARVLRSRRVGDDQQVADQRAYKVIVAYLADDRKAKIELPVDLSTSEAKFLGTLIDKNP